MEDVRKRRPKRPERAMYITPGRRRWESMNNINQLANQKDDSHSTDIISTRDSINSINGDIMTDHDTATHDKDIISPYDAIDKMISQTDKKSISEDSVLEILISFCNLDDCQKQAMESVLIKFLMFLIENGISSHPNVTKKLVETLATIGKTLDQDYPKELDLLFTLMRDKFIEKDTLPEIRRYLMSVIELRAKNWPSARHV